MGVGGKPHRFRYAAAGKTKRRGAHFVSAIAACVLAFGVAAHGALARWTATFALGSWPDSCAICSDPSPYDAPHIAMAPSGDAVAAWQDGSALEASIRHRGGPWQPPVELAATSAYKPMVAINGKGIAVVVWSGSGTLESATRQIGSGGWSASAPIAGSSSAVEDVAVSAGGDTAVVWLDYYLGNEDGGIVVAAFKPARSTRWRSPIKLTPGEASTRRGKLKILAHAPRVAFDRRGDAVALWSDDVEEAGRGAAEAVSYSEIVSSTRSVPTGKWRRARLSRASETNFGNTGLAVNASGDAVAAWDGYAARGEVLEVSTRSASTRHWRKATTIAVAPDGFEDGGFGLPVGIDGRGEVSLGFTTFVRGRREPVRVAGGDATTGRWHHPALVGTGHAAQIAVNPRGDAELVWVHGAEIGDALGTQEEVVQAVSKSARVGWHAPLTLSPVGHRAAVPAVGVDGRGLAAAIWFERGGIVEGSEGR
jgi:hypothetical protein